MYSSNRQGKESMGKLKVRYADYLRTNLTIVYKPGYRSNDSILVKFSSVQQRYILISFAGKHEVVKSVPYNNSDTSIHKITSELLQVISIAANSFLLENVKIVVRIESISFYQYLILKYILRALND